MLLRDYAFKSDRRSVLLIRVGKLDHWYHLSQGRRQWALRTFTSGIATPIYYSPDLANYEPQVVDEVHQFTLDAIFNLTGIRLHEVPVDDGGQKWQQALDQLATNPPGGGGAEPPAPAAGGAEPDEHREPIRRQHPLIPRAIPLTDMRSLYYLLKDFNSLEFHRSVALESGRNTALNALATRFRQSVERFSRYSNIEEAFYDEDVRQVLPIVDNPPGITGTNSLTAFLTAQPNNAVAILNGRPDLNFRYVDREIIAARSPGGWQYENGNPATMGVRLDWLLKNVNDNHPIVAEIKIGNDKNPFFALIQLLTCAAEIVTGPQLQRLRTNYPNTFNIEANDENADVARIGSVDLYIVLVGYNRRSRVRDELLELTIPVAEALAQHPDVTPYIRRIACLEATLQDNRELTFDVLFAFPAANGDD